MKIRLGTLELSDLERLAIGYAQGQSRKADWAASRSFLLGAITEALDTAIENLPQRNSISAKKEDDPS